MTPLLARVTVLAVLAVAAWAVTLWRIYREPRRSGHGLALIGCLFLTWISVSMLAEWLEPGTDIATWVEFGPIALVLLISVVVGVLLLYDTARMLHLEGRGLIAMVPAAIGCLLLAGAIGFAFTFGEFGRGFTLLIVLLGLPPLYLMLMLTVELLGFTLYALIYGRLGRVEAAHAIVVLGAGLSGEEPTPLLAGRVDRGIQLFEHSLEEGLDPILVMSGGQGADEVVSEAEAMARYAVRAGVPDDLVLREDQSTTTEENLRNTRELLAQRGIHWDRLAVVTSSFHVLRTGTLTRRLGIPAAVVGAPTASYYLPAGFLREFVAVVVHHRTSNIVVWLLLVLVSWVGFWLLH